MIKIFGTKIITNGEIDRKKLSDIVFNSKEAMLTLEEITWSFMEKQIDNIISLNKEKIIHEIEVLKQNQEKYEKEKRELYDPNNIFKKSNEEKEQVEYKENINTELQITEYKETFFIKFKKFIFKLLNK